MRRLNEDIAVCLCGGLIYFYFEILFRGYSHYSMILCGGLCVYFVGYFGSIILDSVKSKIKAMLLIMLFGSIIITSLEFVTGIIVNVIFDERVWDYSLMKYNVMGQVCIGFSILWAGLSPLCVAIDILIRKILSEKTNQT